MRDPIKGFQEGGLDDAVHVPQLPRPQVQEVGGMNNKTVQVQVFAAVASFPIGATFTTRDIFNKVKYRFATISSVGAYIARYPGIENTTPPRELAIWRRTQ